MRFQICKNYLLLGFILLENFLFSGVLYGWEDFLKLLRKNELFIHECKEAKNDKTCLVQDTMFFMLYTVCFLAKALSGVLTLQLLKKLSLKYVRMVPLFFIISGGILMAYTTDVYPRMVYSGAVLISIAGGQVLFCSFSVADLFPNRRCTVISLCCGAFCASHAIFYIFQVVEEKLGLNYRQVFTAWAASSAIMLLPNIFLLKELQPPLKRMYAANVARMFAKTKRNNNKKYELLEGAHDSEESDAEKKITSSLEPKLAEVEIEDSYEDWRANTFLASIPFFLHVWWVSVLYLVLMNYSQDIYVWREQQRDKETVLIWLYSPFAMFMISPICGLLLDYSVNRINEETDLEKMKMKRSKCGSCLLLLTTLMVMALLILKIIGDPTVASVILYAVIYPTFTTISIAYMTIRFPWEVFRNLLSVLFLVTSSFGLLIFPLEMLRSIFPLWPSIILVIMMTSSFLNVGLPFFQPVFRSFDSVSVIST